MPHLVNAFGGVDWRFTIAATSIAALGAAGLISLVKLGPNLKPTAPFNPKAAFHAFKNKALRRANFGYLGHMWELYAMWTWILIFLSESFKISSNGEVQILAKLASFAIIGLAGGLGCLVGGILADRLGRTTITIAAMTISGLCAVSIGFFFGGPPWILFAIAMIWGASIVADSPQFSATIVELSPPERIGTMLTVQTCAGFLLTLSTIHLMPYAVELLSWRYAFVILAAGPLFGIIAMARLRNMPEATKLAGGKR
jgi:predicted MFS family arabinose efflux permease